MPLDPVPLKPPRDVSWLEKKLRRARRNKEQQAEEIISELWDQIIEQRPEGYREVVVDVKAREWRYAKDIEQAYELINNMPNPRPSYVRQAISDTEFDELSDYLVNSN